ncbi:MAG: hypothetical protein R2853_20480 [Thermomicrobiales bacterium]
MTSQDSGQVTRRTTLMTAIAAGLSGVLASSHTTVASQSAGKKAKKRCRKQEGQCVLALSTICEGDPDCQALIQQCCTFTAHCDITEFFTCMAQMN